MAGPGEPGGLSTLAVVFARAGELPPDAGEAISEAGGAVLLVGDGAARAAGGAAPASPSPAGTVIPATSPPASTALSAAGALWWCDTGPGLRPGELAARLAPVLAAVPLLILPGTPDGRDLAPRLAAELGRPLLARAARAEVTAAGVRADLCRLDGEVVVPAEVAGPAVATLEPGTGVLTPAGSPATVRELALPRPTGPAADPEVLAVLAAEPGTAALADAPAVLAGGAGLAAGLDDAAAREAFGLLAGVAAALGAVAGATRVATDAGWAGQDRQIGTTGVTIAPRSYVAFGISGAAQHTGGIGVPEQLVSVNTDPHCPMTAMSGLGIVADARATLIELADLLRVTVPQRLRAVPGPAGQRQHEEVRDDGRHA
jgi:electron transfer flavoprotein alpha subunit